MVKKAKEAQRHSVQSTQYQNPVTGMEESEGGSQSLDTTVVPSSEIKTRSKTRDDPNAKELLTLTQLNEREKAKRRARKQRNEVLASRRDIGESDERREDEDQSDQDDQDDVFNTGAEAANPSGQESLFDQLDNEDETHDERVDRVCKDVIDVTKVNLDSVAENPEGYLEVASRFNAVVSELSSVVYACGSKLNDERTKVINGQDLKSFARDVFQMAIGLKDKCQRITNNGKNTLDELVYMRKEYMMSKITMEVFADITDQYALDAGFQFGRDDVSEVLSVLSWTSNASGNNKDPGISKDLQELLEGIEKSKFQKEVGQITAHEYDSRRRSLVARRKILVKEVEAKAQRQVERIHRRRSQVSGWGNREGTVQGLSQTLRDIRLKDQRLSTSTPMHRGDRHSRREQRSVQDDFRRLAPPSRISSRVTINEDENRFHRFTGDSVYSNASRREHLRQVRSDHRMDREDRRRRTSSSSDKPKFEVDERFSKSAFYMGLPPPWDVMPRTDMSPRDELSIIRDHQKSENAIKKFQGYQDGYFEWRKEIIPLIHMANITVVQKFQNLKLMIVKGKNSTLDVFLGETDCTPDEYKRLVHHLELHWGGELRAYNWALSNLRSARTVYMGDLDSVSESWAKVETFVSFCLKNKMEDRLKDSTTVAEVYNKVLSTEQVAEMCQMRKRGYLVSSASTIFLLEEFLRNKRDDLKEATEMLGRAKDAYRGRGYRPYRGRGSFRGRGRGFGFHPQQGRTFFTQDENHNVEEEGYEYGYDEDYEAQEEDSALERDSSTATGDSERTFEMDYYPEDDEKSYEMSHFYTHYGEGQVKVRKPECFKCKKDHYLRKCPDFLKMPVDKRLRFLLESKKCVNCFSARHLVKECTHKMRCDKCGKPHHSLVHTD